MAQKCSTNGPTKLRAFVGGLNIIHSREYMIVIDFELFPNAGRYKDMNSEHIRSIPAIVQCLLVALLGVRQHRRPPVSSLGNSRARKLKPSWGASKPKRKAYNKVVLLSAKMPHKYDLFLQKKILVQGFFWHVQNHQQRRELLVFILPLSTSFNKDIDIGIIGRPQKQHPVGPVEGWPPIL